MFPLHGKLFSARSVSLCRLSFQTAFPRHLIVQHKPSIIIALGFLLTYSITLHARVAEICQSIERRHREIAEILQKLLELDAANKAEAENLLRLAANAGGTAGDGGLSSPEAGPNPAFSASEGVADKNASNDGEDENVEGKSRSLKRRNPFMRAAHAIRKRFSRTSQTGEPVPVAA